MKKLRWIVGIGLVVVIVVVAIVAVVFLDSIVKKSVETLGPEITQVSVALDSVHIGLLTGSAKVKGLVLGNPEGYKSPQAISVGLAEIGLNPFSILSDKIVIRSVHVESPEITFEGGLSGNNLSKILQNVNGYAKTGGPAATNAATQKTSQPGKKIEVDDFLVTGAKVHVTLTEFGGKEATLTLPDIHLTNLGTGSEGLTPAELTRAVLSAISAATVKAVAANATDLGKSAAKAASEGVDKIKSGLGGLLGK